MGSLSPDSVEEGFQFARVEAAVAAHAAADVDGEGLDLVDGGTERAMRRMRPSGIGPRPQGMAATSPSADAPPAIAVRASSSEAMQQIFTLGFKVSQAGGRFFS
jgi:hypothetical protein